MTPDTLPVTATRVDAEQTILACNPESTPLDTIAEMNVIVDSFLAYARQVGKQRDDFMREVVDARGIVKERKPKPGEEAREADKSLVVGGILYTLGHPKDVDCPDQAEALDQLLRATGGDYRAVASFLSADAFKPGSVEKSYPEVFRQCFKVSWPAKLEKDKEPSAKALQKFDLKYLR